MVVSFDIVGSSFWLEDSEIFVFWEEKLEVGFD